jgi:hypothetical protein
MYFSNCKNVGELESAFRAQSKQLHPDMGGNADDFVIMRNEYEERKIFFKYLPDYTARHGTERVVRVVEREVINVGAAVESIMHNKDSVIGGIQALGKIAQDIRHAAKAVKKKPLY